MGNDWQSPARPPANPCPVTPSGRHRWRERFDDLSGRTCLRCGAYGLLDKQGVVRFVDSGARAVVE